MCGNRKGNVVAPARDLTELERSAKRFILAAPVSTRKVPE
jgi:hypothetical protein